MREPNKLSTLLYIYIHMLNIYQTNTFFNLVYIDSINYVYTFLGNMYWVKHNRTRNLNKVPRWGSVSASGGHNSWQSANDTHLINSLKSDTPRPSRTRTNSSSLNTMSCQVCVHHRNLLWLCCVKTGFTNISLQIKKNIFESQFCCHRVLVLMYLLKKKQHS